MESDKSIVRKFIVIILFLSCIFINVYFRLFPAYFPQLKAQAKNDIEYDILRKADKSLNGLGSSGNALLQKEMAKSIFWQAKKDKKSFNNRVYEKYAELKSKYQDKDGQTYLLENDPYQWLRYSANVLKNGHPGDTFKNGDSYDEYMLAPIGCKVIPQRLFFYLSAFFYRLYNLFVKGCPLEHFVFYLPIFYLLIFLIFLYLFVKYLFSEIAASMAMLFTGLNSIFLLRSCAGWFDYEILTITLPLIICWFVILAIRKRSSFKKMALYSLLAALFFGLYSFTWVGYWWVFILIEFALLWNLLNNYSIKRRLDEEIGGYFAVAAIFFIGSIIFCYLICRINFISALYINIKSALNLGTANSLTVFPNAFYTVSELRKANWAVLYNTCGKFLFLLSFCAVLFYYLKELRSEKKFAVTILIFWSLIMLFAAFKSIRFVVFLSIPLGIFLSAAIEEFFNYIKKHWLGKKVCLTAIFIAFIAILFWTSIILEAREAVSGLYPNMNDSWHKALIYIKANTPENAIINTWWDYGNYLKTIAQRRVIVDPQSQFRPLAYWMARVLISGDERTSLNILRMLNNTSDTLFNEMKEHIKDDFHCFAILNEILKSKPQEADSILAEYKFPENLKKKIMENIFFKEPSAAYFLVDKRMVNMLSSISFLANWNFPRVYVAKNANLSKEEIVNNLSEIFSLSREQAEVIYQEVKLPFIGNNTEFNSSRYKVIFSVAKGSREDGLIYFDNGIVFNLANLKARVFFPENSEYKVFKYVYFFDGKKMAYYQDPASNFTQACLALEEKNEFSAIGLSRELIKSLFVKLYFLKGKGLKYFEPFYMDEKEGRYIFRINWANPS